MLDQIVGVLALVIAVVAQIVMLCVARFDRVRWPKTLIWLPSVVGLIAVLITMLPMLESDPTSRGYLGIAMTMIALVWMIVGQVGAGLLALIWRAARSRSA